jgi:hypothetical protein
MAILLHNQVISYIEMKTTTKYAKIHKYPDVIENNDIKDLRITWQNYKKWNDIPLKNTLYWTVAKIISEEMIQ